MADNGVTIKGLNRLALVFEKFPRQLHDKLYARLTEITNRLEAAVQEAEPMKTGKLRASTQTRIYDDGDRMKGVVTITAGHAKAAALEYGSKHEKITVRLDHVAGARMDQVFGARLLAPGKRIAETYERTPNIVAEHFLRGPLHALESEAMAELRAALDEAVDGGNS